VRGGDVDFGGNGIPDEKEECMGETKVRSNVLIMDDLAVSY